MAPNAFRVECTQLFRCWLMASLECMRLHSKQTKFLFSSLERLLILLLTTAAKSNAQPNRIDWLQSLKVSHPRAWQFSQFVGVQLRLLSFQLHFLSDTIALKARVCEWNRMWFRWTHWIIHSINIAKTFGWDFTHFQHTYMIIMVYYVDLSELTTICVLSAQIPFFVVATKLSRLRDGNFRCVPFGAYCLLASSLLSVSSSGHKSTDNFYFGQLSVD